MTVIVFHLFYFVSAGRTLIYIRYYLQILAEIMWLVAAVGTLLSLYKRNSYVFTGIITSVYQNRKYVVTSFLLSMIQI